MWVTDIWEAVLSRVNSMNKKELLMGPTALFHRKLCKVVLHFPPWQSINITCTQPNFLRSLKLIPCTEGLTNPESGESIFLQCKVVEGKNFLLVAFMNISLSLLVKCTLDPGGCADHRQSHSIRLLCVLRVHWPKATTPITQGVWEMSRHSTNLLK